MHKLAAFFLVISRDIFFDIGSFNETFKQQGTEDDELSLRLVHNGHQLFIANHEYVLHNEKDRHELLPRLKRMNAGAINNRIAFDMGMNDYRIVYSLPRIIIIHLLLPFRMVFLKTAVHFPNRIWLDKYYFKLVGVLIVLAIYTGYKKKESLFA